MTEVFLHVYDVTNITSAKANSAVVQFNRLFRDAMGIGGIFHSAIEVYDDEEWSFGYCETGSGVFSQPPKCNVMYCYRETMSLGRTSLSQSKVTQILWELRSEWPGLSYDVLSRNCNHFCDALCERLGVQKPPAWVNRLAHAGDAAVEVAETMTKRLRRAKTEIVSASKGAYQHFLKSGCVSSANLDMRRSSPVPSAVPASVSSKSKNGGKSLRPSFLKSTVGFVSANCCLGFDEIHVCQGSR